MKKNKVFTSALIATLLLSGSAATAATVLAANGADADGNVVDKTGKTVTTIKFKNSKAIDPMIPIDPTEPTVTPKGPLALVYVTDKLDFGEHDLETEDSEDFIGVTGDKGFEQTDATQPATEIKDGQFFHLAVSDTRATPDPDGTADGWHVSGSMATNSDYAPSADSEVPAQLVKGVTIAFPKATQLVSKTDTTNLLASAVTLAGDATTSSDIFSSTVNAKGQSVMTIPVADITLHVPKTIQYNGTIRSTITWTLAAGPTSTVAP